MRQLSGSFKRHRQTSRTLLPGRQAPARIQVRVYDRHNDFARDVQRLHQRGWKLDASDRRRSRIPMEVTRAGAGGLAPQASADRIVARYVCRSTSSPAAPAFLQPWLGQQYAHLRRNLGESIVHAGEAVAGHQGSLHTRAIHNDDDTP